MIARWWPLWLFIPIAAILLLFPQVDLWASGLFYVPGQGFVYDKNVLVQAVYHGVPMVVKVVALTLIVLAVASTIAPLFKRWPWLQIKRGAIWFLLVGMIVGPGLITHDIFKNGWGRPRPVQIVPFGGAGHYVSPGIISDQCRTNCSFYSGHASIAFYLMALAFVTRRKRLWLCLGVATGATVGLVRIIQGGHFLSDVVFAGYAIWLWTWLLYQLFCRLRWLTPTRQTTHNH